MAALTACGGGGGGGDDGGGGNPPPPPPPTGQVAATVVDQLGTPVSGATVTATSGSTSRSGSTGAQGTVTVTQVPTGNVSVTASALGFAPAATQTITVNDNAATSVTLTLNRDLEAAGGVIATSTVGPLDPEGDSFKFRIRVVLIDQDFEAVQGLNAGAFSITPCATETEDPGPQRPNCVRNSGPDFDADYQGDDSPENLTPLGPENNPAVPYAAALLMDSSGSIGGTNGSDPTDARISASKVFLNQSRLGSNFAMLSAFADDFTNPPLIPEPPLTIYPCTDSPCPAPEWTSDGGTLLESLDSLANQERGGTPLHESLFCPPLPGRDCPPGMIEVVDATDPTSPPGNLQKAVVLFSDGQDIYCAERDDLGNPLSGFEQCTNERAQIVAEAINRDVRIYTVGLTDRVNSLAMAELAIGSGGAYLFAETTARLVPIYGALGRLIGGDLPTYEMEFTVTADPGTFAVNRAVLGHLNVATGTVTGTVSLPFAVQITSP